MPSTMRAPASSDPVRSLDQIPTRMAKAESDRIRPSDPIGLRWADVVTEAVRAHYGSVKAAAISLGDVDPSLMMREFKAGNFRLLDRADDETKAAVATAVSAAFGPLTSPKARGRQRIRDARSALDDLDQLLEFLS